jgi:prephenate dehydrogenase
VSKASWSNVRNKEKTGAAAGSEDLFAGRRCIVTPTEQTDPQALERVQSLWQAAGAVVLTMDPYLHDKILGAVSHLPHVAAFALMNALVDIRAEMPVLDLAGHSGGGLRDTTRIAASSPEMWRDIFLWNRENIVTFIRAYERSLGELRQLIETGDAAGIEKTLERAKAEREKFPVRS